MTGRLTTADARRLLGLPEDQRRVAYTPAGPDGPATGVITRVGRLFVFVLFDGASEVSACDPANLELVE